MNVTVNNITTLVLQCIAEICAVRLKQNLLRSTTLDIITKLFDNAAFACVHLVGRFSRFLGSAWLRIRGFQLQAESGHIDDNSTARNYEKNSKVFSGRDIPR